jgi:hypothetical protein
MQADPMPDEKLEARRLNFLTEDYWQKVQYLKDHFTRLWNRFNYFLTIQSALFGATVLSPDKYRWWVPIFAALVCALWYIFGAQDRYLVDLYRKEIEQALDPVRRGLELTNYYFAGQVEDIPGQEERINVLGVKPSFYQWRWRFLSTTKLPALFPVILLLIWVTILLVLVRRR